MTGFRKQILHLPQDSILISPNKTKSINSEVSSESENLSPSSNKFMSTCPFCKSNDLKNNFSSKFNLKIRLCKKHSRPYTCLVPHCNIVFPTLDVFLQHYRFHLNLPINNSVCYTCFDVLNSSKVLISAEHTHQDFSNVMACCSKTFTSMTDFALHKIMKHSATISMIHLEISTDVKTSVPIYLNKCLKDEPDKSVAKIDTPETSSIMGMNYMYKDTRGSYNCRVCSYPCSSITEYIEHSEILHNKILLRKDSGIKLCPLCDLNYSIEHFDEHIDKCTNTMMIRTKLPLKQFGCVICKGIFDIAPKQFRYHFLYCKSFKKNETDKTFENCVNCNFISNDLSANLLHANSSCIYFQLKMKYAMGPLEKVKVEKKLKSCENDNEDNCELSYNSSNIIPSNLSYSNAIPINETQDSSLYCDPIIRKDIEDYNYLCNICSCTFYSYIVFQKHLIETGEFCRSITLWYCSYCLTDFNDLNEYKQHFKQRNIEFNSLKIKKEPESKSDSDEIVDNGDDTIMNIPEEFDGEESECDGEKLSVLLQRQEEIIPVNESVSSCRLLSFQEPGPSELPHFNSVDTILYPEPDYSNDNEPECVNQDKVNVPIYNWD